MRIKIIAILILSLLFKEGFSNNPDQNIGGLAFDFSRDDISKRSSFNLEDPIEVSNDKPLKISFDISLYTPLLKIGNIVTLRNNDNEFFNLKLIKFRDLQNPSLELNLSCVNRKLSLKLPKDSCQHNIWNHLTIFISNEDGYAYMRLGDQEQRVEFEPFDIQQQYQLSFGLCYSYLDVSPFAIRNLEITDSSNQHLSIEFNERHGNLVHNTEGDVVGSANNPIWINQRHYRWRQVVEFNESEICAIFHDQSNHKIVIYSSDESVIYDLKHNSLYGQKHNFDNPFRFINRGGCNHYFNQQTKELILYNNQPISESAPTVAVYNYIDNTQQSLEHVSNITRRHHHSLFASRDGRELYQFGGYGAYSYFDQFMKYSKGGDKWEEVTFLGDAISPRMYSSTLLNNSDDTNIAYIYGGKGNNSGQQRDGAVQYLHDLYRVDIDRKSVEKVAEFKFSDPDVMPCRNMVSCSDGESLLTICYPQHKPDSHAALYRLNLEDHSSMIVSDSIPFKSTNIVTHINLYKDQKLDYLICAIQEFLQIDSSTVRLYLLNTPLWAVSDTQLIETQDDLKQTRWSVWWCIVVGICVLLILVATARVVQRKRRKNSSQLVEVQSVDLGQEVSVDNALSSSEMPVRNALYLMGEFTMFDRNGRNISYLFSAKIKQLFLLILLYTYNKYNSGVSSSQLSTILWVDKSTEKSRNLRGVNLKKLRDILSSIDGLQIASNNSQWKVEVDSQQFYCDYVELFKFMGGGNCNNADVIHSIELLSRGSLLSGESYAWLDEFKSVFEWDILKILQPVLHQTYENREYKLCYTLSERLLLIDPLNEDIVRIGIKSLNGLGDKISAMVYFRKFATLYNETYSKSLDYEDFVD